MGRMKLMPCIRMISRSILIADTVVISQVSLQLADYNIPINLRNSCYISIFTFKKNFLNIHCLPGEIGRMKFMPRGIRIKSRSILNADVA